MPYELTEQREQNRIEAYFNGPTQNYRSYDWKLIMNHYSLDYESHSISFIHVHFSRLKVHLILGADQISSKSAVSA